MPISPYFADALYILTLKTPEQVANYLDLLVPRAAATALPAKDALPAGKINHSFPAAKLKKNYRLIIIGVSKGQTNKQIAKAIGKTESAVKGLRFRMKVAIGADNDADICQYALDNQLVDKLSF